MGFFAGPKAAYAPIPPSRNNQIARDPNTLWPDGRRDGRSSGQAPAGTARLSKQPSFPDGVGERVVSTRERSSFWCVVTVEVLSGFPSVIAEEASPACRVVLNIAIATRYRGTSEAPR
jgi:hypothetical protein